ncbi:GrpB family protein [Terriglobus sp. RCC_193]|uniref:GrpB family protein n=1 Tax=Terriglobus sp. RCC_193 TaxID=3239218 RepID=UPI0035242FFB
MHDAKNARRILGTVRVIPPDASWPEKFWHERERLKTFLGNVADQLEHYGSTAVPGLSAKPIIDMMAPVPSLEDADALVPILAGAGYNKIDAGFFKRRFFRREPEGSQPAYHLHLAVCPGWPIKNELLLRDWLIQNPDTARTYEALKQDLATAYGDDMPRYTAAKTPFLRHITNQARQSRGLPIEHDWEE